MAWTYDAVSWIVSLGQWRRWQEASFPFIRGSDVLELGHGPGHLLPRLKKAGFQVVGMDLSPFMGEITRKRLSRANVDLALVRAKAQALPFASEVFNTVVATFPTEFIAEQNTLRAISRSLRPGGRLVIVPEARLTGGGPLRPIIEWLYAITGQRQGPAPGHEPSGLWLLASQHFVDNGFILQIEQVELTRSVVMVVIAEKPSGG